MVAGADTKRQPIIITTIFAQGKPREGERETHRSLLLEAVEMRETETKTKEREKEKMKTSFNLQQVSSICGRHLSTAGLFLIGLTACIAIGVSPARGQVGYSVEDLGFVKDMEASEPSAINNQGHVAGTGYKGLESCAFHYFNKFMGDAGGVNSRGFGISSTNICHG